MDYKIIKELRKKMLDLNERVYHQSTKEADNFKCESKILLIPLIPDDL